MKLLGSHVPRELIWHTETNNEHYVDPHRLMCNALLYIQGVPYSYVQTSGA